MKTFNITKRISKQAKTEIERILDTHDRYKKSFFFKPNSSADGRRRNERIFAENNPDVIFKKGDDTIVSTMNYRESCNNVYYDSCFKLNGDVKDVRLIKSLLK